MVEFSLGAATGLVAFVALALLAGGYLLKGPRKHWLRIAGWVAFGLYWPTQSAKFFLEDDPVNGYFTLLAPLLFGYLAYHEWLSSKWGEDPRALRWIAGTAVVAAGTYFAIYELPGGTDAVIGVVAHHSSWLLGILFGVPNEVVIDHGAPSESKFHIFLTGPGWGADAYAVTIILACTAIQSIMIFVGAIATTEGKAPDLQRRKWKGYAYTAAPIYMLNLFRNAGIVYGYKIMGLTMFGMDSFEFMHSYVGKGGSLLALVVIALVVFRLLPELHQNILDLFDLPKRRRPGFYADPPPPEAPAAVPLVASKPSPESE
jgi:archaeosortase A